MVNGTIFIAGAGGIGRAAALLLESNAALNARIILGDNSEKQLNESLAWIRKGITESTVEVFNMASNSEETFLSLLTDCDVLLDCLPGSFAPKMATHALNQKNALR